MKVALHRPSGPSEDSTVLRIVVALAVEVAMVCVIAQHAVEAPTAIAGLVLAPLGYYFSYRQRLRSNLVAKILLSVGLLVAMAQFLQGVQQATSVDQARIPLATLFIWVQVLHSFDVPRRRDLAFSMISSLILMAEAGSLSLSTSFIAFFVPWSVLAALWLYLSSRPRMDQLSAVVATRRIAPRVQGKVVAPLATATGSVVAAILASTLVFMAMPRLPATLVHAPPFSLRRSTPVSNFDGGVSNPGLPSSAGDGTVNFGSGAYPGFSNVVDLQARGRLSDQIAFRVRASQPALWRAEAFDTYDGMRWTESDKTTEPLVTGWDGISSQVPPEIARGNQTTISINHVVQTFYIDTPQPNVLFAAASVSQVYFPSAGLVVDGSASIRSPILLDQGLIYSVVSEVPILIPSELRQDAGPKVPKGMQNYLDLPTTLPSRVGDLSAQIVAGKPTEFDRVEAVQSWLRANTKYNLDVPVDPAGVDAVDRFLFVTRQGFCEHIASAMAVMLRTQGIPTRLVTGYGPGDRNPLTGYLEVKESDAHAWVEVYYPRIGWVPYDPTFGVPEANPNALSRFMAGPALAAIARVVRGIVPEPVKRAIVAIGRAGVRVVRIWQAVVGFAAAVIIVVGFVILRRRRKRAGPRLRGAEAAFAELAAALAPAGHVRRDAQTPSEFLLGVRRDRSLDEGIVDAADLVVRTFERDRFAPSKPTDADVMRARAAAARARDLVGKR